MWGTPRKKIGSRNRAQHRELHYYYCCKSSWYRIVHYRGCSRVWWCPKKGTRNKSDSDYRHKSVRLAQGGMRLFFGARFLYIGYIRVLKVGHYILGRLSTRYFRKRLVRDWQTFRCWKNRVFFSEKRSQYPCANSTPLYARCSLLTGSYYNYYHCCT